MARSFVDPEIKAQALADLLDGEQPAVVAERYGLPGGTVRQWKNRLVTPDVTKSVTVGVTSPARRPAVEAQQLAIGELVLMNVKAKLFATQKIAEYATTPAWLDKQTAADVATLFTAIDRSAIDILDRMARRGQADSGSADGAAADNGGDGVSGVDLP